MSDFKIVKCKKCDAALVELKGEKLKSCVQCGYNFGLKPNKIKNPHFIPGSLKKTPGYKRYLAKVQNLSQTGTKKKKISPPANKKKSNPIATIIIWIIVLNIIRGIFW